MIKKNIFLSATLSNHFSIHTHYDAIFIIPEKLTEADIEKHSEVSDVSPKSYATGYLHDKENNLDQQWRFTKEKQDKETITGNEIKKIYSEIFSTIHSLK